MTGEFMKDFGSEAERREPSEEEQGQGRDRGNEREMTTANGGSIVSAVLVILGSCDAKPAAVPMPRTLSASSVQICLEGESSSADCAVQLTGEWILDVRLTDEVPQRIQVYLAEDGAIEADRVFKAHVGRDVVLVLDGEPIGGAIIVGRITKRLAYFSPTSARGVAGRIYQAKEDYRRSASSRVPKTPQKPRPTLAAGLEPKNPARP